MNVATPPDTVPLPIAEPPSKNVTVPVGVPDPDVGVTVAVNMTDCPITVGLAELATAVVVGTCTSCGLPIIEPSLPE
jgi:hypothetical protein